MRIPVPSVVSTFMTSFDLNFLLKTLSPNTVALGVRTSTWILMLHNSAHSMNQSYFNLIYTFLTDRVVEGSTDFESGDKDSRTDSVFNLF